MTSGAVSIGATIAFVRVAAVSVVCVLLLGCSSAGPVSAPGNDPSGLERSTTEAAESTSIPNTGDDAPARSEGETDWGEVGVELIEMARVDQEERADFGNPDLEAFDDGPRTVRLAEIVDRHGWPTPDLAGIEANRAAFLLAQHAGSDLELQRRVLALIKASDPYEGRGEQEALLTDRIATNSSEPQLFGTQVNCLDGRPVVSPELARPDDVDQLRSDAGLEPLGTYLARFDQHCARAALIPEEAGCERIGGFALVVEPNAVVLVGELHGTAESPSFVAEIVCSALSYGYAVTVGLEIPDDESDAIEAYLRSDGEGAARDQLLAGTFWTTEWADGRQSRAMFELIDELRAHTDAGHPIDVVMLDTIGADDRDAAMAERLLDAITRRPDSVVIALTGNIHNRTTRGTDVDPDFEPMGYLVEQALGPRRVRSLDVSYTGGQAWACTTDATCGPRRFDAPPNTEPLAAELLASIEIDADTTDAAFDGRYLVGDLTPSPPAVGT